MAVFKSDTHTNISCHISAAGVRVEISVAMVTPLLDNFTLSDKVVISDLIECADRLTLTTVRNL